MPWVLWGILAGMKLSELWGAGNKLQRCLLLGVVCVLSGYFLIPLGVAVPALLAEMFGGRPGATVAVVVLPAAAVVLAGHVLLAYVGLRLVWRWLDVFNDEEQRSGPDSGIGSSG